ncbi:hypothetical protein CV014_10335 [Nostoc sp. CMAA1605]|nr:hypothetical protein [Nostoc sp. CMAA1605]
MKKCCENERGLGIGDWGLGIGHWALGIGSEILPCLPCLPFLPCPLHPAPMPEIPLLTGNE